MGPVAMGTYMEKQLWYEIYGEASKLFRSQFRSPEDWPRLKVTLAAKVVAILRKYFHTIEYAGLVDLSGGECVTNIEGSFDIDVIVLVRSPAESYALMRVEEFIDNAIKEAFFTNVSYEKYRELLQTYERGLKHNVIEIHVNDVYALKLARSSGCPPIDL
ncbi:MAG: hypothetical protein F7C09_00085 [Aeropyrum sp.]|nr:hypothetical protein [Aeropyrum sp.]